MCLHMCVRVYVCLCIWRPEVDIGCYPCQISAFFFLIDARSLPEPRVNGPPAILAKQLCLYLPVLRPQETSNAAWIFLHGSRGSKLRSLFLYGNSLSIESSPQPGTLFILLKVQKKKKKAFPVSKPDKLQIPKFRLVKVLTHEVVLTKEVNRRRVVLKDRKTQRSQRKENSSEGQ